MKTFLEIYAIGGLLGVIIGIIRFELGKQSFDASLSTLVSWFFFWPYWLGSLIYKTLRYKKYD